MPRPIPNPVEGPLWRPSNEQIVNSTMARFSTFVQQKYHLCFEQYQDLHNWSVTCSENFWKEIIEYFNVKISGELHPICLDLSFDSYGWFPHIKLNFAENLLQNSLNLENKNKVAFLSLLENGEKREISYEQLVQQVASLQNHLRPFLQEGDVLGAYMPNIPETAMAMLAATSLGAVFTSTSCDFGVDGVLDRFLQSKPKVLLAVAGYQYNGKIIDLTDNIKKIVEKCDFLQEVIVVDFLKINSGRVTPANWKKWGDWPTISPSDLKFVARRFDHPLYIMYSSGTTGKPKCIVHSIGGTLLQHIKELGLHCNLKQHQSIFFFTTCGWMMWNWLISALYFKSTVVLYEGSPSFPNFESYMALLSDHKINIWGTSPKFLKALENSHYHSKKDLSSLHTILSTGAPLLPEQFDYVYQSIKKDVLLSSISGGTDIIGCFMLGNPILPVYRGEIQCKGLGMDVAALKQKGQEWQDVYDEEGELVCKKSFPSRPLYFLNDHGDLKLKEAYFKQVPPYWYHGDFITISGRGGVLVHGRSDATLNPGGVRIGTAEIYRQTEKLTWIADSLCVGKQVAGDVEVYLYIKLADGIQLSEEKMAEVKSLIKKEAGPRHVPSKIIAVTDIPYTRSGKKMELLVTRLINRKSTDSNAQNLSELNLEAVANPECLKSFKPD